MPHNERSWWAQKIQPKLHRPQENMLAWKMQDAFVMGRPDVLFNVPEAEGSHRLVGWLELKYRPAWPARSSTLVDVGLTAEQYRHLDSWYRATKDLRTAIVLFGVADDCFLYPYNAPCLQPGSRWTVEEVRNDVVIDLPLKSIGTLWSFLVGGGLPHFPRVK